LPDLTLSDFLALGIYIASWIGYTLFADYSRWRRDSIMKLMDEYRERWMLQMLQRENRMVDANIIASQQNGAAFFASTTIFALGGLMALLGASEQAVGILSSLPLAEPGTAATWRAKLLLMIAVLAYAFFKFAWTFRLQGHCAILLGATPEAPAASPENTTLALRAARIGALAARHFNRGLRAYFFALAALAWFLHPLLFVGAIAYVLYVLYRREFRSRSLKVLQSGS
jgi:uncharacterized membrane protein